ncbi:S-adenosyl-L-methionine-dependent methyltransferase [Artemisia annua]|uniref:S-adenosyl-L-methionine-dependent methyltransferase n=1 Tax=Artemisia annua TaxID=35608 RepID=A0A2U1N772_ARTAN|nr:S-adenosyl-L-methionine-dependent methyltransferase [Artemisia annua]
MRTGNSNARNGRRLKEEAVSDYNELKSFGSSDDKEIGLCARGKKHYVPCYNVAGNVLAGFRPLWTTSFQRNFHFHRCHRFIVHSAVFNEIRKMVCC